MDDPTIIRIGALHDLAPIKGIADANRNALGFLPRAAIARSIDDGRVFVAERRNELIGFLVFRHRRDGTTTLLELCIDESERLKGAGRALVAALEASAAVAATTSVRLKCPDGAPANAFYERLGFQLFGTTPGKRRPLKAWHKAISGTSRRAEVD